MPRQARLDAPDTLHHVMVRGIVRGKIVDDEAEAKIKYQLPANEHHRIIDEFIGKLCTDAGISVEELRSGSRRKEASLLRADIAIGLVKGHGVALAEVARRVGVSTSAI